MTPRSLPHPRVARRSPDPAQLWAREERRAKARKLVDRLLLQLRAWRLPTPVEEHRFHPERRWRFDLAWLELKVAVEVDGLTPGCGAHQRIAGVERDREKDLAARELGWDLIRVTGTQIRSGAAVRAIAGALERASGAHGVRA